MKSLLKTQSLNTDVAALLLRLIFGGLFVHYGLFKVQNYDMMLTQFPDIIGIGAGLSFNLVVFAEFICGIFVLLGFLTRFSVVPIFITMIVAYFIAHAKDPFDLKQVAFIHMLLCLVVFVLGSGNYSVDALLFNKNKQS